MPEPKKALRGVVTFPTIEQIREALGVPDDSQDAAIAANLAATIAIVEAYLGRGIQYAQEIEEIDPPETRMPVLMLFRFPIETVESITQEGTAITGYRVYKPPGVVRWHTWDCCFWSRGNCGREVQPLVVTYTGGYPDDAWPADLADAVMRAFYGRWQATGNTGNTAQIIAGPGNRSVSIDGLTITRDSVTFAGSALADQVIPPELTAVAAQLDPYRARRVGGF